jgi:hypothetical protein
VKSLFQAFFWSALFLFPTESVNASPYFELGTSLGKLSSYDQFFGQTTTGNSSNLGFCGSLSFYVPVTSPKNIIHLDLGLQNRMYFVSNSSPQTDLAMVSVNIAARLEFYRFFVGAGYSPLSLVSTSGPLSLHSNSGATGYFGEGGVIWRVVPELQIVATYAMEYGTTSAGTKSPSPASEYGLRFRFPISPYKSAGDASDKFDGFRYPFGIMR